MFHRGSMGIAAALALIGMSACGGISAQSDTKTGSGSQGDTDSDAGTSGKSDAASGSSGNSTTGTTTVAQCSWPDSLNPPEDAGPWGWTVARYWLNCQDGPDHEGCLSNDPTTCPGPNAIPGATDSNCVDQCNANEYAVSSGGPPDMQPDGAVTFPPTPTLPASCRSLGGNPAGVSYSCCPCE
jgi:hypothetical protein